MNGAVAVVTVVACVGCRDISSFSTGSGHYEGAVINASFVLAGVAPTTTMCLTLDTDRLQESPGLLSTNDQRFRNAPLRSIPQVWHDPLSTLSFGDGRIRNLLYVATTEGAPDGGGQDVVVVISLMQAGDVEVRLIEGAPRLAADGGPAAAPGNLFAVFDLVRSKGPCSF
jgi:hypothetical protein